MKVKELIEFLLTCNENDEVVLSSDAEGNKYSPLIEFGEYLYVPEYGHSGDIHLKELTLGDMANGYSSEDLYEGDDGIEAVVLWPTN